MAVRPSRWVQEILTLAMDCTVYSEIPSQVPTAFVLHTVRTNVRAGGGDVIDAMDVTLAISCIAPGDEDAWNLAMTALQALNEAVSTERMVAGTAVSFFDAIMLPVRQPRIEVVTVAQSAQYDAIYRLIFTPC